MGRLGLVPTGGRGVMTDFPGRGEVWWCEMAEIGRRPVVVLSRDAADEPRNPHRRDHPAAPRHRGPGLLPTQASRGQEAPRSDALPEATHFRCHLSPARRRRATSRHGSGRALRGVSRIQRGRPAPAHRHFGSATSRTRETDATTGIASSEDHERNQHSHRPLDDRGEPV